MSEPPSEPKKCLLNVLVLKDGKITQMPCDNPESGSSWCSFHKEDPCQDNCDGRRICSDVCYVWENNAGHIKSPPPHICRGLSTKEVDGCRKHCTHPHNIEWVDPSKGECQKPGCRNRTTQTVEQFVKISWECFGHVDFYSGITEYCAEHLCGEKCSELKDPFKKFGYCIMESGHGGEHCI